MRCRACNIIISDDDALYDDELCPECGAVSEDTLNETIRNQLGLSDEEN